MKKLCLFIFLLTMISLSNNGCCLFQWRPRRVAPVEIVCSEARYSAGTRKDVSDLIVNYMIAYNTWNRAGIVDCLESTDHSRRCICRGLRRLTVESLVSRKTAGYSRIKLSEIDRNSDRFDIPPAALESRSSLYDLSKAEQHILFTMDDLRLRYGENAFERDRFLSFEEAQLSGFYRKHIDQERKRCEQRGVIAVLCSRGCRMHRRCYISAMNAREHQPVRTCPNLACRDNIVETFKDSENNFIMQEPDDILFLAACLICRKPLWRFR